MKKVSKEELKKLMIQEGVYIIETIQFYEKRYEEIILEIDEAGINGDYNRLEELGREMEYLDKKIFHEEKEMEKFKNKYSKAFI